MAWRGERATLGRAIGIGVLAGWLSTVVIGAVAGVLGSTKTVSLPLPLRPAPVNPFAYVLLIYGTIILVVCGMVALRLRRPRSWVVIDSEGVRMRTRWRQYAMAWRCVDDLSDWPDGNVRLRGSSEPLPIYRVLRGVRLAEFRRGLAEARQRFVPEKKVVGSVGRAVS